MKQTMVYIGPSIGHLVQTGTAFKGGYAPRMEAALKREPFLNDLMIPVEQLSEARKELRNPESGLAALYRRAEGGKHGI